MNKIIIFLFCMFFAEMAIADCTVYTKNYTACKKGYYLTNKAGMTLCEKCPSPGTSDDGNNTDYTACYIPAGTIMTDETGTFTYTSDCHYSK